IYTHKIKPVKNTQVSVASVPPQVFETYLGLILKPLLVLASAIVMPPADKWVCRAVDAGGVPTTGS
ncbi:MAG: hypothetical protein QM668_21340, partial [Agriterribacter sp.]